MGTFPKDFPPLRTPPTAPTLLPYLESLTFPIILRATAFTSYQFLFDQKLESCLYVTVNTHVSCLCMCKSVCEKRHIFSLQMTLGTSTWTNVGFNSHIQLYMH